MSISDSGRGQSSTGRMSRSRPSTMTDVGSLYSPTVGMVFVFNLIVGTGALAMPHAFQQAGWLLSLVLVTCIAFTSYVTVTYVLEAMACANAVLLFKRRIADPADEDSSSAKLASVSSINGSSETTHLLARPVADDYFRIRERVELGQMVSLFFNKVGVAIFYVCIIVYLYGDLAIYAAAVPKSLRDIICVYKPPTLNCSLDVTSIKLHDTDQCFPGVTSINRMLAYRLCVIVFSCCLGPFVFFNVQKTAVLQVITTVLRWLAFGSMIVLAIYELSVKGVQGQPKMADISKVPNLFGVCVYSFMCHHSLPSLVTPIRNKKRLNRLLGADYGLILVFYSLLSLTAVFAFPGIPDLYTLTFEPTLCPNRSNPAPPFFQYFLALFPVFTLSTNFPIIGITLRNNLKTLCLREGRQYHFVVERLAFPVLVLLPPVAVALGTNQIDILVGITGSYAGAAIQYFIPVTLVYFARRCVLQTFGMGARHSCESPFRHGAWLIALVVWALACVAFVTAKYFMRN